MGKGQEMDRKLTNSEMAALYYRAKQAGLEAGDAVAPIPMTVLHANVLTGEVNREKPTYYVPDGVCGFAWVNVRPGNSRFANFLKTKGFARADDNGGVTIRISEHGQSVSRKEAHASGLAEVLLAAGIKAYSDSRLD